ncbi:MULTISPECIES: DMT family transporter [Actinomadura]|uniref:EamA family transporter n=1 Tax=Actinomadura litoris TaxID=2678616 RepID=A0A7K1L6M4_9ACTN|nr:MULTISPECIES: DMT family transporter [Actinomadura]MBT2209379.1 DMT family transporter [Actinomadura sp. NEAU-AAG7]MUN40071.1 EamA family transporter [Actinomadura litoris]
MRNHDSATASTPVAAGGLWLASIGVLIYSFTFPGTEFGLEGLDPYVIGVGRSAAAAGLAAIALLAVRARRPRRDQLPGLAVVCAGVIFGFPVLTTLALDRGASSGHSAVVIGLLPAATAVLAVLRAGERPSRAFWLASGAGAACVTGFALVRGAGRLTVGDLLLFAALLAAAAGYAEGARLTRDMPGWRVISWALVLAAPVTVPVTGWLLATTGPHWTGRAALGFGYVTAFSAYLGFFAWYEGLARAGIARASQVQLTQPVLTLVWSALLLEESIDATTALAAVGVLVCVALTQRTRVRRDAPAARGRVRSVPDDLYQQRDDPDAHADRDGGPGRGGAQGGGAHRGDQDHQGARAEQGFRFGPVRSSSHDARPPSR